MGLAQEEGLVVFYIRLPRETERLKGKKWRTQEDLALNQPWGERERVKSKHPLQYRKWRQRLTWKAQKSLEAALRLELKSLVCGAKCKLSSCNYRHPPVFRNYQSGNRCIHGNHCLFRHADGEEKPSKKSKKESTPGAFAILRDKKGPTLCTSKFRSKEVYFEESWANEIERFGGTHHKILRTHLVRNSNSGKKRAIWRNYPKRWTSWAKSLRAHVWGKNTWGNLKTRRVCPQSSMGFGEKNYTSSRPRTKRRFILLWK